MEKFDVFIPSLPKDFNKLKIAIELIKENIVGYDGIYVTTPEIMPDEFRQENVNYFTDKETFDMGEHRFPWRHNWLYQMYLKMFQKITKNDWCMTIDSDVMVMKPLHLFEDDGRPIQWLGRDQNHRPYFKFQEEVLGIGRIYNHSFINDMNFFNRRILKYMIQSSGMNFNDFLKKSVEITDENCHPGEPEMYGNYVYKHYPNMYSYRHMETYFSGKNQSNLNDRIWADNEIRSIISKFKNSVYHLIMLHSWT